MTLGARPLRLLAPVLLLVAALAGCSSDATAPQDRLTLSVADAAGQSGLLAWATTRIGPHFLKDPTLGAPVAKRTAGELVFSGAVTGSCAIAFTDVNGADTAWNLAAHGHMATGAEPLRLFPNPGRDTWTALAFDLAADIARSPDVATIAGSGSVGSGPAATTFVLAAVTVPLTGYPGAGSMTLHVGGHVAVVTFNGTGSVACVVDGSPFTVNLATGAVTAG